MLEESTETMSTLTQPSNEESSVASVFASAAATTRRQQRGGETFRRLCIF